MDKERIKKLVRELIIELGEDPTREGLKDTPRRIADAYSEIFSGYDSDSGAPLETSSSHSTADIIMQRTSSRSTHQAQRSAVGHRGRGPRRPLCAPIGLQQPSGQARMLP